MIAPELALVLLRFLVLGAAMLVWGTSAFLAALVPARLCQHLANRLNPLLTGAAILITVAMVASLPALVAGIGEGWTFAADAELTRQVVLETEVGHAWLAGGMAATALLLARLIPSLRGRAGIMALLAALLLATRTLAGHAAMNPGWLGMLHGLNDLLHMLSAGAWVGALLPVGLILPLLVHPERAGEARLSLMRFSSAGHGAVALTIASGAANTRLILGRLPTDWSNLYQSLLSLKITLVGCMVLLALANRYILVPKLPHDGSGARRALLIGTAAEILLAIMVTGLVAWFGTLDPVG